MRLRRSNSTPSETRPGDEPARHREDEPRSAGADDGQRHQLAGPTGRRRWICVDRPAGQPGDRDGGADRQGGQPHRPQDPRAVGAQESEQPKEGLHTS